MFDFAVSEFPGVIVDPDFLDHWRTTMVATALGASEKEPDELAPLYVLRLWGHCQTRRADRFDNVPPAGVAGICRYKGDPKRLEKALIDAGYLKRVGSSIEVPGWSEHNASLIAAWQNGARGGRPKSVFKNGSEKPMGNPALTHGEPIREDKRRVDKKDQKKDTPSGSDLGGRVPPGFRHRSMTLSTYLAECEAAGVHPLPKDDQVYQYAKSIKLPKAFLDLAWNKFCDKYEEGTQAQKKYQSWRQTFRNAIEGNWLKLWWMDDKGFKLTTAGQQAQREMEQRE